MNAYFFHVFLFLTTNVFTFSVYFFFHVSAHFSRVSSLLLCLFVHCLFFFSSYVHYFFLPFLSLFLSLPVGSIQSNVLRSSPLLFDWTKPKKGNNSIIIIKITRHKLDSCSNENIYKIFETKQKKRESVFLIFHIKFYFNFPLAFHLLIHVECLAFTLLIGMHLWLFVSRVGASVRPYKAFRSWNKSTPKGIPFIFL